MCLCRNYTLSEGGRFVYYSIWLVLKEAPFVTPDVTEIVKNISVTPENGTSLARCFPFKLLVQPIFRVSSGLGKKGEVFLSSFDGPRLISIGTVSNLN